LVHFVWAAIPPGVASLNGRNYRDAAPDINDLMWGEISRREALHRNNCADADSQLQLSGEGCEAEKHTFFAAFATFVRHIPLTKTA
jgi:hypothetical protein